MRKVFCDKCEKEITDKNSRVGLNVTVEIDRDGRRIKEVFFFDQDPNHSHNDVCMHCIIDAVNRLDNRPQPG